MTISFSAKLSASPDTLINLVDKESVLLDLKSEQYFGLNETGTRMWSALMETRTIDGACEKLLTQFDVDPAVLRKDLEQLVEKLIERGLAHVDAA
jgi:hypothetical protein